jgi:hypothetical protein
MMLRGFKFPGRGNFRKLRSLKLPVAAFKFKFECPEASCALAHSDSDLQQHSAAAAVASGSDLSRSMIPRCHGSTIRAHSAYSSLSNLNLEINFKLRENMTRMPVLATATTIIRALREADVD